MSGTTDTAREIYTTGLRNQHAVENQAIELLERQGSTIVSKASRTTTKRPNCVCSRHDWKSVQRLEHAIRVGDQDGLNHQPAEASGQRQGGAPARKSHQTASCRLTACACFCQSGRQYSHQGHQRAEQRCERDQVRRTQSGLHQVSRGHGHSRPAMAACSRDKDHLNQSTTGFPNVFGNRSSKNT
jgi:hypothetical protein